MDKKKPPLLRNSTPDNDLSRGERFAQLREFIFPGESRSVIGEKLGGYNESTVRKWEDGLGLPNRALSKLLQYNVSMGWLLTGEGEMKVHQQKSPPGDATAPSSSSDIPYDNLVTLKHELEKSLAAVNKILDARDR